MKKLITFVRDRYTIVVVALLCTVLGAATSSLVIVHASIPDTSGTIHGCRNNTTTMLRVVDSDSQSCDNNESSLNWDQRGVKAYGYLSYNSGNNTFSIDSNRSFNISNPVVTNNHFAEHDLCLTISGTPQNVLVSAGASTNYAYYAAVKDANGWTSSAGYNACNSAAPSANVYMHVYSGYGQNIVTIF